MKHFLIQVWKWKDFFSLWLLSSCFVSQCRWVLKTKHLLRCPFQAKMSRCFLYIDKENSEIFRGGEGGQHCLTWRNRSQEKAAVHVSWWRISNTSKATHQSKTWILGAFHHMCKILIALSLNIADTFCSQRAEEESILIQGFFAAFMSSLLFNLTVSLDLLFVTVHPARFHWLIAALG